MASTPSRSAIITSSARAVTCIFSITRRRWALIVLSARNLLVHASAHDALKNLPLAGTETADQGPQRPELLGEPAIIEDGQELRFCNPAETNDPACLTVTSEP